MTAKLLYQLTMMLPENELELYIDMIEPHMKKFDLNELILDEIPVKMSKNEIMLRLIDTCFSKVKNS